ncbi:MAG: hypothetical protein ACK42Y_08500 [Candidatus Thermochlorobacter sp.]
MLIGVVFLWLMGVLTVVALGITAYQYLRYKVRPHRYLSLKKLSEQALRDSFRMN